MTTDADLDDLLAALPLKSPREVYGEIEAARRAAELAPPPEGTIIPMPEYPYIVNAPVQRHPSLPMRSRLRVGARRRCLHGGPRADRRASGGSAQDINRIFNERSGQRAAVLRGRVETAIRGHITAAHSGREIPTRGVR